jgi:hypothetical protein
MRTFLSDPKLLNSSFGLVDRDHEQNRFCTRVSSIDNLHLWSVVYMDLFWERSALIWRTNRPQANYIKTE